jgi:lipopolysaccharide export system protein LptC
MTAAHDPVAETPQAPFVRSPLLRSRLSWTARNRASAGDVKRYSRFVDIMKKSLAIAAAALLASVLAYALQPRQQERSRLMVNVQNMAIVNNDLTMTRPRLSGVDSDGNPYIVTADAAAQDIYDSRDARLENVQADLTLKSGAWISASATHGRLHASAAPQHGKHKQSQLLYVSGIVNVYSDNGYEMHTSAADIDFASGTVVGDHAVNGLGPLGTFRADRFRAERDRKTVYLYGNVRMTLQAVKKL